MSNNIPNFNNILDHAKLAEEYLDASALNEEQKTAVKDSPQYKAYVFGLSTDLASKFDNPFQILALTELNLPPEQALLVQSPVTFNDIKENNLTHSQILTILQQEQYTGNVKVSARLKFAEERNLDPDLVLLLQYPAQFKAIEELNMTIAEAIRFGNGESKESEIKHKQEETISFFNNIAKAVTKVGFTPGKVYAYQLQPEISRNHSRSEFEFEVCKADKYIKKECNYSDVYKLINQEAIIFLQLDDLKKAVDIFSNKVSKIASIPLLLEEYNKEIGIHPNITTFKDVCDARNNNHTFKDQLLNLKDSFDSKVLDFYSIETNSFCEAKSNDFVLV